MKLLEKEFESLLRVLINAQPQMSLLHKIQITNILTCPSDKQLSNVACRG